MTDSLRTDTNYYLTYEYTQHFDANYEGAPAVEDVVMEEPFVFGDTIPIQTTQMQTLPFTTEII